MVTVQPLPANLATKCDKLSPLDDGLASTLLLWFPTNIPKAHDCADRHEAVVDVYNEVREAINSQANK